MTHVEFSEEIRDRILYHWSELGDRPKLIWTRLQEEGFNVDLNTVQALMQCEDEEAAASGTIAEHENEESRDDRASISPYPEGKSPASTESPASSRFQTRRGKNRDSKSTTPQNRRTKLTPDVLSLIEKILDTDGNIYSLAALQAALLIKGVKISKTTTFRALEKLGRSIVVKKMNFSSRVDMAPIPEDLRKNSQFASKFGAVRGGSSQEGKRRQHTLTIREMEALEAQTHLEKDHHDPAPRNTAATSTSTSVSTTATGPGTRMETESKGPVLVLPPKKAATATSSSLKLVLGHGGFTSYTSAPMDEESDHGDDDGSTRPNDMPDVDTQESVRSQSPAERILPTVTVKKEVIDDDDYEVKIDDDYELDVVNEDLPRRRHEERPGSQEHAENLVVHRSGPRGRERVPVSSWMERTHDNDDEAAILEARAISRRRLSHPRDEAMIGSDEEFDSDPETMVKPKRPCSLGRSSVGSVHSTHSAHSAGSRTSHSSHGFPKTPEDLAKSGRSSSTFTSQSGSSGGSGGMERSRRSPVTSSSATAAAMAAAGMRQFPLTFHRSQMCNAAAMASHLAHGITPDMGAGFHVGQRRLPLSAGRGGVKQPFMSKYQRNIMGMRQAMASGMPRRMQRMSPGFPLGIPLHKYQKMMRMHQAMGKAMRGMHHFGRGRGRGRGRFHGDLPGRHMRNMRFNEAPETASPHSPDHFSGDEISPELEIDPPETYGEFAERIFSSNHNQRQTESGPETNGTEKWMEDISHRLEVIESQLQLILEHLPFMGGAEMQSVSSDPGGPGSEVDSGLQEDSGAGPGGAGDDRSGGGGDTEGGGEGGGGRGDRSSEKDGEGGGGGTTEGETGERSSRKHMDSGGSRAGSTSSRGSSAPGGRDRDVGRHIAMDKCRRRGGGGKGCRRGDARVAFCRTGAAGTEGRHVEERQMEDDGVIMIEDKADEGRFPDNLSEFGDMRGVNSSQTDVRIEMVVHDARWDEMTPYAGAPRLAIALARYCIFGTKILVRSSVTGRNSKHPLDFAGMRKIKHLLFQKYGSRCSPIEFEVIWKTSRESISQLCKRLRRKYNASGMGQAGHDDLMGMNDFMVDCPLLS